MLLAIDIGNTNIVLGVYDGEDVHVEMFTEEGQVVVEQVDELLLWPDLLTQEESRPLQTLPHEPVPDLSEASDPGR